jgi:hypothetical protein
VLKVIFELEGEDIAGNLGSYIIRHFIVCRPNSGHYNKP